MRVIFFSENIQKLILNLKFSKKKKKKNTDKHAPMKQKRVKGNGAPFMTREI